MNLKNIIKHLHKINKHRYYVCKNCFKAHQYKRGLLHDLSKYSPTEFLESVKYYDGKISPITKSKKENGWSKAWQHHKGWNPHHWEYWIDNIYSGYPEAILIPFEYVVEMLCDYIGAGQAYNKNWTPIDEYKWWNNTKENIFMHPVIEQFISKILFLMAYNYEKTNDKKGYYFYLNKKFLKSYYDEVIYYYRNIPNHYRPQGANK